MRIFTSIFVGLALTFPAFGQEAAIYAPMDRIHPVWAENGMVAAQEAVAAKIGLDILQAGGNA